MRYLRMIPAVLMAVVALASCKSQYEALLDGNDSEAKYTKAFEYFEAGKYQKAAQLFESLSAITNGTERDDTVQYYWGLSNYRFRDYYTAETNFGDFIAKFPRSTFAESAKFLRLDCLYRETYRYELDQTPTYTAIASINEFLLEHPTAAQRAVCDRMLDDLEERLDKKAFENARLYYKMEDYLASRVAFRNVLKDDADNRYREEVLYYMAMSSYKYALNSVEAKQHERYLDFIDDYYKFIEEYPESSHKKELDSIYKKVKER